MVRMVRGGPRRSRHLPLPAGLSACRLDDFTERHVRIVLPQHSAEIVLEFPTSLLRRSWDLTPGQPWLGKDASVL